MHPERQSPASPARSFCEAFARSVERFGGRPAVEIQRKDRVDAWTFADIDRMAARVASFLAARGVARGDRCAILAGNDARWVTAYLGTLRIGAVAVPLDTAYGSGQIATLFRDSAPRIAFTSTRFLPEVAEAAASAGGGCEVVLLEGESRDLASCDEILSAEPRPLPPCPARPDEAAAILYSSGTTGDPKGVVLTHANLLAEIEAVGKVLELDERDVVLGVLPLYHALPQIANLLLPFAVGARVVYLESVHTAELLRALAERGITAFACVPQFFYLLHQRIIEEVRRAGVVKRALYRALLAANGAARAVGLNLGKALFGRAHAALGRSMRYLVAGGSRFDPRVGRDLYSMGFEILQAYGLTETSGAASMMRPGDSHVGSVGPPLPGVEIRIAPPEATAESGAVDGEVLIRGPIVMPGYHDRPEVNARVLEGGWLRTGDLGRLDAAGRLYITGRKKEVIVLSSGKNIYPEEIEAHYLQSPYIKELCVMGLARPGEPAAERLHAVVVPDMDAMRRRKAVNTREILRFEIEGLSARLPGHKRVLGYEVWNEDLPRTTTRKLKRFEIRKRAGARDEEAAGPGRASVPAELSEAEQAWAAAPDVARALEAIAGASRQTRRPRPEDSIELDLGLDSMERVELLTHLEQVFGTDVPDEVSQRIYTVRELVEAVVPRGGAGGGGKAGDPWSRLLEPGSVPADDRFLRELSRPKRAFCLAMYLVLRAVRGILWLFGGLRVRGLESLPERGPYLICPNHESYLDVFLLVSALPYRALRRIFFVGASEYFATPLRGWLARKINLVPVDPDANLVRAMQAGAHGLRLGKALVLFPEGERSIDGELKRFKKGAAILSAHLQAPIVPVAIDGAREAWPRGGWPRWRRLLPCGGRVGIRVGAPLPPTDPAPPGCTFREADAHYSGAAERLRDAVAALRERPPGSSAPRAEDPG